MKIRLLMPAADTQSSLQCAISMLIDEHVAIDTGGLPYLGNIEAQKRVEHVLLTHSHIRSRRRTTTFPGQHLPTRSAVPKHLCRRSDLEVD